MLARLDWKFFLTLALAAAGVAVPVWLWQSDLTSKALTLRVISTTELRPQGAASLAGVQVSLDGKIIDHPFLSVLEIANTGSKPILSSDFESQLDVLANPEIAIIKTQITFAQPKDLTPIITATSDKISIVPLLLNPKDTIQLTVLTSGATPHFVAHSRIAGISTIPVSEPDASKKPKRYWASIAIGVLLLSIYLICMGEVVYGVRRGVFRPWDLAIAIIAMMGGTILALALTGNESLSAVNKELFIKFSWALGLAVPLYLLRLRQSRIARDHNDR